MIVKTYDFGMTENGKKVDCIAISNGSDMELTLINRGATLTCLKLKNRKGILENCILGFKSVKEYEAHKGFYGATIGRVANRISASSFLIDGVRYNLNSNDGKNTLHGGPLGFDKVLWDYKTFESDNSAGVNFSYTSPDGDENFPGNLKVNVSYTLTPDNQLIIDYKAECDKKTPVNLTNHTYWNLSGFSENIHNHNLQINADTYLPVNNELIPTGDFVSVKGTPFDFSDLKRIGENIKYTGGFDHNFNLSLKPKQLPENHIYVEDPSSGRCMEITTTEPGVQFYTGFTDHMAFCLETQRYPDAVNCEKFESIILSPGEIYKQKTVHKFFIKE